uniref:uncharacterized protein LOC120333139 n=1 Tax=Styela clava TaxID=7725 RepID=UPI0019398328|nr:uncharacterized protein LOC120333139 [Styela clava]
MSRMPEKLRIQKYSHYATNSPLKPTRDDIFKAAMKERRQNDRAEFVLDGVREHTKHASVIPSYNAFNDRHSQVYFRSPRVQAMLRKVEEIEKNQNSAEGIENFKLSTRQRIPHTPYKEAITRKESRFVIDCVRTDTLKSKRKPVIPSYNAIEDEHSQSYFRKKEC